MIDALVFSKQRPLQLDGFLQSLERWAPHLYRTVTVLYVPGPSYDRLRWEWPDVDWMAETDFEANVEGWLWFARNYVSFHCDDDLFFRPPFRAAEFGPFKNGEVAASLRLGLNTTWCHPLGLEQETAAGFVHWPDHPYDFGYPFALNGHVYRADTVRRLLREIGSFRNPNDLEHRGVCQMKVSPQQWGEFMWVGEHSCLVSVPANRVQDEFPNPCTGGPDNDPAWLVELYELGYRLDLDRMDFSNVVGGHQEIPFAFLRQDGGRGVA